jgi:hypothetical protein
VAACARGSAFASRSVATRATLLTAILCDTAILFFVSHPESRRRSGPHLAQARASSVSKSAEDQTQPASVKLTAFHLGPRRRAWTAPTRER